MLNLKVLMMLINFKINQMIAYFKKYKLEAIWNLAVKI